MGLKAKDVDFSKDALREIINGYAREAGVRNLENQIKKILRKIAMKLISGQEKKVLLEQKKAAKKKVEKAAESPDSHRITANNLKEYLENRFSLANVFMKEHPWEFVQGWPGRR